MRWRGAALVVSGLVAVAALGASLTALEGSGPAPVQPAASFRVVVLHPLLPTDLKTDRVVLDITNIGTVAGWPKCKIVATAGLVHRGATVYWSTSKVRPAETVRAHVRLTIVNGGVRFISFPDVAARCRAASGAAPPPPPKPHVVVPAVTPATLPPRDVGNLQMFTALDGIAVGGVEEPNDLPGPAYLLSTTDGGASWSVTGSLPIRLTALDLVAADLAFESQRAGYLEVDDRSRHRDVVYVTSDAGAQWQRVTTPGDPTDVSLDGGRLWSVTDVCTTPTLQPEYCHSQLLTYRFGALRPTSVVPIPVLTQSAGTESRLLRRLTATSGIFTSGGTGGTPHDLVVTSDAGHSWQLVGDPCAGETGMPPVGLVVSAPGRWLLLCELDGGMMNYSVRLYGTGDAGGSWQLVAERNVTRTLPQIGRIGAGFSLTVSGDGRTLWLLGVAGGVSWSRDGGPDWTGFYPINTGGGEFVSLVSAGASDAWIAVPWQGLYFTANGTTWRLLP